MWNRLVPHTHVVDKNQEGYLGCGSSWRVRSPRPTPASPPQGSSARKRSPHNFWPYKPARIVDVGGSTSEVQAVPLKGPTHRLTLTHHLWVAELGQQHERHQRHMGRNWNAWHEGKSWIAFSQTEMLAQAMVHSVSPPPTETAGRCHQPEYHSLPSLVIPWDTAPWNLQAYQAVSSAGQRGIKGREKMGQL